MRRTTRMKIVTSILLLVFLFLLAGCSGTIPLNNAPTTLSPPTGVSASDLLVNKVQITWDIVSGASHYQVYRTDTLLGTKTAISGWQTFSAYIDTSVTPETIYYYWVKAATSSSGDNASYFSDYDTGYASSVVNIFPNPFI